MVTRSSCEDTNSSSDSLRATLGSPVPSLPSTPRPSLESIIHQPWLVPALIQESDTDSTPYTSSISDHEDIPLLAVARRQEEQERGVAEAYQKKIKELERKALRLTLADPGNGQRQKEQDRAVAIAYQHRAEGLGAKALLLTNTDAWRGWIVRKPNARAYFSTTESTARPYQLSSLLQYNLARQVTPAFTYPLDENATTPILTRIAEDAKRRVVFHVEDEPGPLFRLSEGKQLLCFGAIEGTWKVAHIQSYEHGFAYLWCINNEAREQALIRITTDNMDECYEDAVHQWCPEWLPCHGQTK